MSRKISAIKRSPEEQLQVKLTEHLRELEIGERFTIVSSNLRRFWPEQSEEELRAGFNTNDLERLADLKAHSHGCEHEFNERGDLIFTKKSKSW